MNKKCFVIIISLWLLYMRIKRFNVNEFYLWLLYMRMNRFNDDEFSIWLFNELTALSESSLSKLWLIKNVDEF